MRRIFVLLSSVVACCLVGSYAIQSLNYVVANDAFRHQVSKIDDLLVAIPFLIPVLCGLVGAIIWVKRPGATISYFLLALSASYVLMFMRLVYRSGL